ncbi:MAG: hypothetical protein MMC33_009787 [Icmadophila ericetorum]|nr:hypothetical protein [Icmadophila ericetorum]
MSYQDPPHLVVDAPNDMTKSVQQRYTPSASPSMSMAHSLDHTYTSLSTSCPSIKSTASSTVSSPYSHATHSIPGQDQWIDTNALGIANGFKTEDSYSHDSYSIPGMEGDQILFENSTFPDPFVGESRKISSTIVANSPKAPSPMSSASTSQSFTCSAFSSSHLSTGSPARGRNITIDTILENVNGRSSGAMSMISPISAASAVQPSPVTAQRAQSVGPPDHCSSNFKSPSMPASVMSPYASRSSTPFISRRQSSAIPEHSEVHSGPSDSLRTYQYRQPNPAPSSPENHYRPYFQTPFFTQSSGRFVAPLESSYPSLIQPFDAPSMHSTTPHANMMYPFHPQSHPLLFQPPSPAPSDASSHDSRRPGSGRFKTGISSPYLRSSQYHPYPQTTQGRRMSISSSHSRYSQDSPRSLSLGYDDEGRERDRCPNPDCGKTFKDLKAHMLTHQSERPEKCPIQTCEYHQKGFARKYDKQRHTLTHYKGTMVCGFCPGSGSAAEKSFNRADVFKRHLTSVHGVEQAPPNSRKKSPSTNPTKKTNYNGDVTGKCSTCSATFNNAQDFYEHLDECVLRVVQQEEPSEAINAQNLEKLKSDEAFQETLERHMLSSELDMSNQNAAYDEEDDEEDEEDALDDDGHESWTATANGNGRSGKGTIKSIKRDLS